METNLYPIAKKDPRSSVTGLVIDLCSTDISKLDDYETEEYTRKRITLTNGQTAWAYLGD